MMLSPKSLAGIAHINQTDKAGRPYIHHIKRVVDNLLRRWPDADPDEIAAAWLHDVIEDTVWNADDMLAVGISQRAVSIVKELSRPAGSVYLEWIADIARHGSLSAVKVKLADNEDNSMPERVATIPDGYDMLRSRYIPARALLMARLTGEDVPDPPEDFGNTSILSDPAASEHDPEG